MTETRIVSTSGGPVEVALVPGHRTPVLFFPGGHCSAAVDTGWDLYTELGYGVVSFSRPGYGGTRVGALTAAEFTPLVREVCRKLGISVIAAAVGVSFGGLQAVHVAQDLELRVQHLVLHSCAPSVLPYPDTRAEALVGPVLFSPVLQGMVWALVRQLVRGDAGLRLMMGRLSLLPVHEWWDQLDPAQKNRARQLFRTMGSDSGFINDLRQGRAGDADARRHSLGTVRCPTLVTGSRHDRGVAFVHSVDFASVIPGAVLVETDSPSHIFWIGPDRERLAAAVSSFVDG
jgi:pimeloyl-ACP methyl ester carboxylesterase